MWRNRLLYLCAFVGAWAFYAWYTAWVSFYVLLLVLLAPLFSLLCSLPGMRRAELKASMPGRVARDVPAEMELWVQSGRGWLSPLCRFALLKSDCMAGETSREWLRPAGERIYVPLPTAHCGAVKFRFAGGKVYDRLGLFSLRLRPPEELELLVEPRPLAMEPAPALDAFAKRGFKPKPGGGFAEVYETREYRPGDPVRDIHWKLSAKTDKLIVREAQQPESLRALITMDLSRDRDKTDRALGQLMWLSRRLLELDMPHRVCCARGGEHWFSVSTEADIGRCVDSLLRCPGASGESSLAERHFAGVDWRCHIGGEGAE